MWQVGFKSGSPAPCCHDLSGAEVLHYWVCLFAFLSPRINIVHEQNIGAASPTSKLGCQSSAMCVMTFSTLFSLCSSVLVWHFYFSDLSVLHFGVCTQVFQKHSCFLVYELCFCPLLGFSFIYYMPLKLFSFLGIFCNIMSLWFALLFSAFHLMRFSNLFWEIN